MAKWFLVALFIPTPEPDAVVKHLSKELAGPALLVAAPTAAQFSWAIPEPHRLAKAAIHIARGWLQLSRVEMGAIRFHDLSPSM